ncbi:MAG TPA: hypothetical protein VMW75_02995 [Thermoanaerobaculia bacterium]|nr:hypothetical protein [Thermoanaerobaculia bacterium]
MRLETIRRQAEPWREASENLAGGRIASALDAYQQAGRLHLADTRAAARTELLAQVAADRATDPGSRQLVLAYRNEDVQRLNAGTARQRNPPPLRTRYGRLRRRLPPRRSTAKSYLRRRGREGR